MFSLPRVNLALEFCSQSSEFFRCLLFNRLACLAQNLLEANVRLAALQHAEQGFHKPLLCGCNASAFANRFEGQRGSNRFTAESTGVQLPSCFQRCLCVQDKSELQAKLSTTATVSCVQACRVFSNSIFLLGAGETEAGVRERSVRC